MKTHRFRFPWEHVSFLVGKDVFKIEKIYNNTYRIFGNDTQVFEGTVEELWHNRNFSVSESMALGYKLVHHFNETSPWSECKPAMKGETL